MVTNLISETSGNAVRNQFIINDNEGLHFQSYRTHIATIASGVVSLNANMWDYSKTTSKYLYQFLRQNGWYEIKGKQDVLRLIKNGTFKTF